MHGSRFSRAISCARRCFLTVIGKYVPPLTVASLHTITHSRPATRPTPVMIPADGAALSYMSYAASCDSSRNGVPGSSSIWTRSRGSSLPRAVCLARASGPPPTATALTFSFRSATSARMASALPRNSGPRAFSLVSRIVIVVVGEVRRGLFRAGRLQRLNGSAKRRAGPLRRLGGDVRQWTVAAEMRHGEEQGGRLQRRRQEERGADPPLPGGQVTDLREQRRAQQRSDDGHQAGKRR